jgi:serine/threonine protein kinase
MEQEYATYKQLYEDGDLAQLMAFLESAQYVVYDVEILEELSELIEDLLHNPDFADSHDALLTLFDRLGQWDQERVEHMAKSYKIRGKGTFGCVVEPALPNRIEGHWVQHPTNVSKLFHRKENVKKATRNSKVVTSMLETNAHRSTRQITWRGANFPPSTQANCNLDPNAPLYSLRMPNLGISIKDLAKKDERIQAIPVRTLFEQFLALMEQVQTIQARNYVHGDIHIGNILIHPKTGVCTMIDFDWFSPKDKFFRDYREANGFGFYANPPESLLMTAVQRWLRFGQSGPVDEDSEKLEDYQRGNNTILQYRFTMDKMLFRSTVRVANQANFAFVNQGDAIQSIQDFEEAIFPTFDSYGLGLCLLELSTRVFPYRLGVEEFPQTAGLTDRGRAYTSKEQATLRAQLKHLYEDILLPMTELELSKRKHIASAVEDMRTLLANISQRGGRQTRKRQHISAQR